MDKQIVHVVGGGLVGPLTAIFLAKKGIDVELYERRGDIRKGNVDVGRSINLVITDRGLKALDEVGIKDKALEIAIPMRGRMLHDKRGNLKQVPYGQRKNEVINAISRGLLNSLLLEEADKHENINIHFHKQCTGYDLETKKLTFHDESSKKTETIDTDIVIGTDGAWSAIRKAFLDNLMNFSYSQSFLEHSYKELIIPPGENDEFRIEDSFLHIWPRENFMLIALPNIDGSFTCTLFYPREGENSFAELKSKESITAFFESEFPDALDVMPTLCEDFVNNPTSSLATIKCGPWHYKGQALLIGDASHGIVPFFGQGMNCGFEDCSLLGELVHNDNPDWETIFNQLYIERKPNTDAIADMAIENFVEMRETTANPKFQLKKQIGFELEKRFPNDFIPRYSMVMFHPEIPYADAKRLSELQDNILETLSENVSTSSQINWDIAEKLIKEYKAIQN